MAIVDDPCPDPGVERPALHGQRGRGDEPAIGRRSFGGRSASTGGSAPDPYTPRLSDRKLELEAEARSEHDEAGGQEQAPAV